MIRKLLVLSVVVFGAVLAAPAAYAQYQPGTPGIILIPSTTTPGATVTVQGFGCARLAPVTVAIDGTVVATTTTADDSEGSFETTITAPATVGIYAVTATCGATVLNATLTVNPAAVAPAAESTLPATGNSTALTFLRAGLALVAAGGFVLLALRQRHSKV